MSDTINNKKRPPPTSACAHMSSKERDEVENKLKRLNLLMKNILINELWLTDKHHAKLGSGFVFNADNTTVTINGISIIMEVCSFEPDPPSDDSSDGSGASGEDVLGMEYL